MGAPRGQLYRIGSRFCTKAVQVFTVQAKNEKEPSSVLLQIGIVDGKENGKQRRFKLATLHVSARQGHF